MSPTSKRSSTANIRCILFLLLPFSHAYNNYQRLIIRGGDNEFTPPQAAAVTTIPTTPDKHKNRSMIGTVSSTAVQSTIIKKTLWGGLAIKETFFNVVAVIAVAISAMAMISTPTFIVMSVGVLCLILGPTTAMLQRKLSDIEQFRELTNDVREEVNLLTAKNKALSKQNIKLEDNIGRLKQAESTLEEIGKSQGLSVQTLVKQVNEYKQIQHDLKENLKAKIRQNLLSIIFSSDTDEDFMIDPEEVDLLALRLSNIPGVIFNEKLFRKSLQKTGSIPEFTRRHLSDTAIEKERIFLF